MINRLFISIIFSFFLLVSCQNKEVDFVSGTLYRVTTTEGDGFAMFERKSDKQWSCKYYLSESRLIAKSRTSSVKVGNELSIVDDAGREIPILSYSLYEEPEFKNFAETWMYRDSAYAVTVNKDVVYGHALGYWTSYPDSGGTAQKIYEAKTSELERGKRNLDLTMDVYLPNDSKETTRPLLVLVHGGAFFNGDKADLGFPEWARSFANLGYVVASVNYRLGFKKNLGSIKRAGFRGVQDVDAAIRYIICNKDKYLVDPERVFVAGTSAGGITALNVAFMRNEDIPSDAQEEGGINSVNPEMMGSYNIRAVGNMWGAVNDLSILCNAPSSVISFHSTGDPVVPYGKGHPFDNFFLNWLIFPTMYGSEMITECLGSKRAVLNSYDLPGCHTLHVDKKENGERVLNSRFKEIEVAMRNYFSDVMLASPVIASHNELSQTFEISSPEIDEVYWQVEGGAVLKQGYCRIEVLLFPDVQSHSVTACGKYKSGLTFRTKWEI